MSIRYPKDNWILQRSGEELEGLEVEGTYFINYAMFDETMPKPWGAQFTHIPKNRVLFDSVAEKVDYAVCLNSNIKKYLEDKGVKKVVIIRHGCDERVRKIPVFGWCGKSYNDGRKGEDILEAIGGVLHGDYDNAPDFYKKIDYLIIASRNEGAPVVAIDAIAAGVPVIGRKGVGWLDDLPIIRYETDEELKNIVKMLRNPWTWGEDWVDGHRKLFAEINDLY